MKNINLTYRHTGLKISKAFHYIITSFCMVCAFLISAPSAYSTIIVPGTPPSQTGVVSCASSAATAIQSVAADITALQAAYSSDCSSSLTIIPINEGLSNMSSDCSWEYFRNYTINEDNGSSCNEVITVTFEHFGGDNTPPSGSFSDITNVNACATNAPAFDMAGVAAAYSSNCGSAISVNLTGTSATGDNCGWTVTYTYDVNDSCTSLTGESYKVSGSDGIAPTGSTTAGSTGTNACFADAADLFSFDAASAAMGYTSGCGSTITAIETGTEVVTGGDCAASGGWTVTYTFKVVDACGNELTGQTYTHTGSDQSPPTGASTYVHTATNGCISDAPAFNIANALMGFSDGTCTGTLTASLDSTTPGPSNSDCNWSFTYNYTVTDGCSNPLSDQSYTISGGDMTDPTVVTQVPATYDIDATACSVTVNAADIDDGSSDNCGSVTLKVSKTGVSADAAASVSLIDGIDYDISVTCDTSDLVYLHVIDDCNNEVISPPVTVMITANVNTLSFPEYADVTEPIVGSDCNQNVAIQKPVVTTACGIPSTPVITTPGTSPAVNFVDAGTQWIGDFPLGTTTVRITVTDGCGNVIFDEHTVTITDGIVPDVSFCPSISAANTTSTTCDVSITYSDATATENCGFDLSNGMVVTFADGSVAGANTPATFPASYTASPTSGNARTATFAKGHTEITWTFMDASGNTSTCKDTVIVTDATPPTVTNMAGDQSLVTSEASVTGCPATGTSLTVGASLAFGASFTVAGKTFNAPAANDFADNCPFTDGLSVKSVTPGTNNTTCSSTYLVVWEFTDCGGNKVPDDQLFTITDNSAPTSSTTGDIMNTSNPVNACKPANNAAADAYFNDDAKNSIRDLYADNCQTLTNSNITLVPSGGTMITGDNCSWTVTHTFTVNDGCGNSTSNRKFVTKGGDETAPTLKASATTPVVANKTMLNDCASNALAAAETASSVASEKAALAAAYEDTCGPATLTSANVILIDETSDPLGKVTKTDDCLADGGWEVTREYQIQDACMNKTSIITIKHSGYDQTAPAAPASGANPITSVTNINACAGDALAAAEAASPMTSEFNAIAAAYTDVCGPNPLTSANVALISEMVTMSDNCGTSGPFGQTGGWEVSRVYEVTDACGNKAPQFTVKHSGFSQTAPTFGQLHPDMNGTASAGCTATVDIQKPTGNTSQCGSAVMISIMVPAGVSVSDDGNHWTLLVSSGITNVSIVATDGCGLQSFDDIVINIAGGVPTFVGPGTGGCPNNITPLTPGTCDNPISFTIDAQDNCGATGTVVDVAFSGNAIVPANRTGLSTSATVTDTYFQGITTVTLTARNAGNGSSISCSFTIESDPSCGSMSPCVNVNEVVTADITAAAMPALFQAQTIIKSEDPSDPINPTLVPGTLISSGDNVAFYGGTEVLLLPNFEVQLGGVFLGDIAVPPCTP